MLSIILPTYNESESIVSTIKEIKTVLKKTKIKYEIIISDDNSPDKTIAIARKAFPNTSSVTNGNVRTLLRTKNKGLSPAVIDGFSFAKGNILLVMDGDGQHDPNIIPKMYALATKGKKDLVLGTRYAKGGSVGSWSASRLFMSKFASALARPLMRKNIVSDPMSGFFLIRRDLFDKVRPRLKSKGYKILLDIIFASKKRLSIGEVPYTFRIRKQGESKLGFGVMINYGKMLLTELIDRNLTLIKFGFVGALGTIINLGLLYVLVEFGGLHKILSSAIAIEIAIINNFLFNHFWTFKNNKKKKSFVLRGLQFNLASLGTIAINMGVFILLTKYYSVYYLLAQFIGIVVAFILNFLLSKHWVFKQEKEKY